MASVSGYEQLEIIHESASTVVYRAIRATDRKAVVIRLAKMGSVSPNNRIRYRHEFELLNRIDSPFIIKALELIESDTLLALVTEDCGSEAISKIMEARSFSPREVIQVGLSLTQAIDAIHSAGITHCDINPSNILLGREIESAKLIDFELAITRSDNPLSQTINQHSVAEIEGTVAYISPEQSGRTNRIIDYRTDFYSLGVTLYELLTRRLPFTTDDPLELIHSHIAKQPDPPQNPQFEIPSKLAGIVLKLLEKLAENRYQDAKSIGFDLADCLPLLSTPADKYPISFTLASADKPKNLVLTQDLRGRKNEKQQLLEYFNFVANGGSKVIFYNGEAGIGKSALVHELQEPVSQRHGYFVVSKYNPLDKDLPYQAFTTAMQQLIRHILSEPDLAKTRTALRENLNGNGQLLINLLPDLENVIGEQPDVPILPPEESRMRLALTFSRFLRTVACAEHPIVMFLDDVQLIDISSIELLETLLFTSKVPYFFAISAIDSSAFAVGDTRVKGLIQVTTGNQEIERIDLGPLTLSDTQGLIADSLDQTPEDVMPLAEVAQRKTGGNPYFIREFLHSLYENKHLSFNSSTSSWNWDLDASERQNIADNVSVLLADKLGSLPAPTIEVIKFATCHPDRFSISALSVLMGLTHREIQTALQPAIDGAYLIRTESRNFESSSSAGEYRFSHIRIHQAAYALLTAEEKKYIHSKIGKALLQSAGPAIDSSIFDIVNQLNNSLESVIQQPQDRIQLAQLNYQAGKKSKESSAYQPAYKHFKTALALSDTYPDSDYIFVLDLYLQAAECAFLCRDDKQLDMLLQRASDHASTNLDKARVLEVKLDAEIYTKRNFQALDTGNKILRLLDIRLPRFGTWIYALVTFTTLMITNRSWSKQTYNESRKMKDPVKLAAMRVLMRLSQVSYLLGNKSGVLYILKMTQLSNKHGMAPESSFAYPLYGALLISTVGRIEAGYHFGELAINNLETMSKELQCKTLTLVHNFIMFWKQHLRDSLEPLAKAHKIGNEVGDSEFALIAAISSCSDIFMLGYELSSLEQTLSRHNRESSELNDLGLLSKGSIFQQATLNLLESDNSPWLLQGDVYDERISLPYHQETADESTIANLFTVKLFLAVLFNQPDEALAYTREVRNRLATIWCSALVPFFFMYESLAIIGQAANQKGLRRYATLSRVRKNQRAMKKWTEHAPMNIEQKFHLVAAEKCKLEKQDVLAIEHYERAVLCANTNGYLNEEGLANELTGRFYLSRNRFELAAYYLNKARSCFARWSAISKVTQLDNEFGAMLKAESNFDLVDFPGAAETISRKRIQTTSALGNVLDFESVIKASQALTGELVLDEVLKQLMNVVLENAAAHKVCLILNQSDVLVQEITAFMDDPTATHTLDSIPLTESKDLPVSVIQYVARTAEDLVLNNVSNEDIFTQDPYIVAQKPHSILCIPVTHQNNLTGVLYLENSQSIDAFSPDRLTVLKLLASQSAIAIENAKLYREVDDSRDRYLSLYENAIEGIFEADHQGQLINVNPAAASLLGYENSIELVQDRSKPGFTLFDDTSESLVFYNRLLGEKRVVEFEKELTKKDGTKIWISMSAQIVSGKDDGPDILEGSIIDVSERKKREEADQARLKAEAATSAKSEFLAQMSHEIRTPMNAILGYTHLALGTELNNQQVSYLETIQTSSNHLLRVINDILDISKIEAGKVEFYHQMFTLEGLFNELSDLFRLDAKKKQVSLNFSDVSVMDLPVLFGDPVRIGQILINLISNSFKFTDEGKIEVLATHERISENRLKLSFAVIDTGIGIDKSQVDIIFDSFSQAATPSGLTTSYQAAKNEGAGLGLSICKHLVSLMGGAISVDSTPGVGSRFDFTIYVDVDQEQEILPANIRGRPIKSRSWLQGVHILLVEDNLINQQLTQEVLESEGLIVTLAENGAEAVEAMENQEFAAILMDLRMPVMDGFEALVLLRQNDKYNHIPILAMSAGALQHEIDNALKSGFDDYITKPVSFDKLFNKLLSLIDDRYFSDKIKSAAMVTPDTPECVSLLEIPEIDVMDAIDNHNNNISLFVRLLDDFVDYYEFAPSTIEEHLANREIEQAERLSHNVAGVAGSFAAKSLHKLAKDLEHAISAGDKSKWESILPQFSKELNSLTNSIKQSDLPAIKEKLNA